MLEAKLGLQAIEKAEAEAEKAAGLGLGAELIASIEARLKAALGVLKAKTDDLLEESAKLLEISVPTVYCKVLAGLLMMLAAAGIKLVLVAYNFVRLSSSEEGKNVAKEAKEIVYNLHKMADKLTQDSTNMVDTDIETLEPLMETKIGKVTEDKDEDSPSMVQTNKETHGTLMEKLYQHVDSTKQEIEKLKQNLEELERLVKDVELKGGEAEDNYPRLVYVDGSIMEK